MIRRTRSQADTPHIVGPDEKATTALRLLDEGTISAAQAAAAVPPFRPGRKTGVGTIMSWILRGRGNPPVYLEAMKLGGRWVTSRPALARFAERLTAAKVGPRLPVTTPSQRRVEIDRTARELDRAGFGSRS